MYSLADANSEAVRWAACLSIFVLNCVGILFAIGGVVFDDHDILFTLMMLSCVVAALCLRRDLRGDDRRWVVATETVGSVAAVLLVIIRFMG